MDVIRPKKVQLYRQIRRGLRSGRYRPGQRIDPNTLANESRMSVTPVRSALDRLVGEGLLADHSHDGFHVPLFTELALRDLYDWMQRLLLMACEMGRTLPARTSTASGPAASGDDVAKQTWQLFDAIARTSGQRCLHRAVEQANDRLAPIRRAKQDLFEDARNEVTELNRYWHASDLQALKSGLCGYHDRRKALVPSIVAMLNGDADYLIY